MQVNLPTPTPCLCSQLAALFAKFGGVLEEYEERRAERMARMQSEVGAGPLCVRKEEGQKRGAEGPG